MNELFPLLTLGLLWLLAVPTTLTCIYLLTLTLLSGKPALPRAGSRRLRFDIIVPAHNEDLGIAKTVASLLALDWPPESFRVVVVADNCIDETANCARLAGATVLERHDLTRIGKGYALAEAFKWSRSSGGADAVVVVDADSTASNNLLKAFAARIEQGASACQAHYGVLNPDDSWRTRLMAIALGSIHKLRSRARERLKLSCGIRGNGWCVTLALLDEIPYHAYSLTEDVEFGADLGLSGRRVAYCDEADVNGEMVSGEQAARSQRRRWEGGRFALIRDKAPLLLRAALAKRSLICLDLALDLLVLPLSYIVLAAAVVTTLGAAYRATSHLPLLWAGIADCVALLIYVGRGWRLSGIGISGFWDLLRVPVFLAWKIILLVSGGKATTWIRTKREGS
jgi:1,2-diacylglycerol 3-beta-glucosyltransferase